MKTLNVKSTTKNEVESKWGLKLPYGFTNKEIFIRCDSKGNVNWDNAPVYIKQELEERGDYQIIVNLDINEFIEKEL
jgi:hypothetical protein